ncbi:MAG: alpha/beta hydrolase [Burkholderiaceae bacterium]|nr:alpha/beta hydrolase [Burkholderiaceae bacterium]
MSAHEFIDIDWAGRHVRIEHQWLARERADGPLVVFLHEGLGSLAMWKDFPARLCDALGARGLVYSRPGYGRSTPRGAAERWQLDFMHRQAHEVLPTLLDALHVHEPPWLFGHSDGASIALLYASRFPGAVQGLVLLAPHIRVEPVSVASIQQARAAWHDTDLRQRLAKYHVDPASAFFGWNDIWLDPGFTRWNIESELPSIACPLMAIQGLDDEYGTLEQIHGIARALPGTRLLELPDCGHSPHRDQPVRLIDEVTRFITEERSRRLPA